MRWIADGVFRLGRFRPTRCASWVLHGPTEAALLEFPPSWPRRHKAWNAAWRFLREQGLRPKMLLATHAHWDHVGGYVGFRRRFRKVPLVAHASFLSGRRRATSREHFFDGRAVELDLDGEPLYLVHAPKHSPQDTLVVYRGTVCTGDWTIGAMPDCTDLVPRHRKVESLRFLRGFLAERRYRVHTLYSVHGNDLRRGIDFDRILAEMERYWSR